MMNQAAHQALITSHGEEDSEQDLRYNAASVLSIKGAPSVAARLLPDQRVDDIALTCLVYRMHTRRWYCNSLIAQKQTKDLSTVSEIDFLTGDVVHEARVV